MPLSIPDAKNLTDKSIRRIFLKGRNDETNMAKDKPIVKDAVKTDDPVSKKKDLGKAMKGKKGRGWRMAEGGAYKKN